MTDTIITTAEPEYGTDPQDGPQTPLGAPSSTWTEQSAARRQCARISEPDQAVPRQHRRTRCPFAYYRDSPPRRHREVRNGLRRMGAERVAGRI